MPKPETNLSKDRDAPADRYIASIEERLHLLGHARQAIDIIAMGLVEGGNDGKQSGQALLYLVDRIGNDLSAINAALDRYATKNPDADNVWSTECP